MTDKNIGSTLALPIFFYPYYDQYPMSELVSYLLREKHAGKMFWLNIATAVGIYGGFPRAPKVIKRILKKEFMGYAMTAILIYQGGGEQNLRLAMELAILLYFVNHALYRFDSMFDDEELPMIQRPP